MKMIIMMVIKIMFRRTFFTIIVVLAALCSCSKEEVNLPEEYAVVSGKKISRIIYTGSDMGYESTINVYDFSYDEAGKVQKMTYSKDGKVIEVLEYTHTDNSIHIDCRHTYYESVLFFDESGRISHIETPEEHWDDCFEVFYNEEGKAENVFVNGKIMYTYTWKNDDIIEMYRHTEGWTEYYEYGNIVDNFNIQIPCVSWFDDHSFRSIIEMAGLKSRHLLSRFGTAQFGYTRNEDGDICKITRRNSVFLIEYE